MVSAIIKKKYTWFFAKEAIIKMLVKNEIVLVFQKNKDFHFFPVNEMSVIFWCRLQKYEELVYLFRVYINN